MRPVRRRFWVQTAAGAAAAFLTLLTLVVKDWVEVVFGIDPDLGSGSLEWFLALTFAVITLACAVVARAEWARRRLTMS